MTAGLSTGSIADPAAAVAALPLGRPSLATDRGRAPAAPLAAGSLQDRLILLAIAAILPMLVLFLAITISDFQAERARAGQRQLEVARGMAGSVERELRGATASLQALALSPRLQDGDLAGFRDLATRFVATQPPGSVVILMDASGQHLVNTRAPPGAALPRRLPEVTAVTVAEVFRTGKPLVSNLLQRKIDGPPIVTAEVPVFEGHQVIYDLSLVLPAERFANIIADQHLPAGIVSSIYDRAGVVVARLPNGGRLTGQAAPPELLPTLLSRTEGILPVVSMEGVSLLAAFSRSEPSSWSVCIGTPEAILNAPLRRSLLLTLGGGLLGLLCSAAVAAFLAQRVLGPIRALARYAAEPQLLPAVSRFGLREVDEVVAALRESDRLRQTAMTDLKTLNEGLGTRVRQEIASRIQAQEKLAQAQRMEALGQLAGGIAHDFNNVLQAVTGGLNLIRRRAADPDAVRRLAGMAANAADRGAAITGRLLTFARRGELKAVPIAPTPLLRDLREMLAATLGAGIVVRLQAADDLPPLLADKAQLETVLVNLAVNARDAMPGGGELTLSAAADIIIKDPDGAPADAPVAPPEDPGILGLSPGSYIRLDMTDQGTGMDAITLARAAEPFFTTKGPGHGTGLGLAMARGFAVQSGGGFALASELGHGTRVTLWLPQVGPEDDAPGIGRPARSDRVADAALRILLVDDDAMVREILAGELEEHSFVVTTAADGAAALALIDRGQPIDLLVTDFAMPGLDGLSLIRQVRRRLPGLPALLLTGYAEATAEAALADAEDRLTWLLRKPISGEELATRATTLRRHAQAKAATPVP